MDLFDLAAKITLDSSGYEEGLTNAESKGSGFAEKLKKGFGTAAKVGGAAIAAVGAGAVDLGKKFVNGVSDLAQYGDQIDKNSQKMGISAQAYQEWDFILQHSGSSIDSMSRGMMTLSNKADEGNEAFQKLGISQEELATLNKEDLFARTIEGLQQMGEGMERDAIASDLFGGAAKELGPLLNTSADDVAAMRQQVNDLGGVMGDDAVKDAAAFQDALQNLTTAFDGLKNGALADFLPAFTSIMDGITAILGGDSASGVGQINEGVDSIVTGLSEKVPAFMDVGFQIIEGLVSAITENLPMLIEKGSEILLTGVIPGIMENLPLLVETAFSIIGQLVSSIGEALPELIPAAIEMLLQLVDGLINNIDLLVDASITLIMGLTEGLMNALPTLIAAAPTIIQSLVSALIRNLPKLISMAPQIIMSIISGLVSALPELIAAAPEIVISIISGIVSAFGSLFSSGADMIAQVKEGFMQKVAEAKTWGSDMISNFINGITAKAQALIQKVKNLAGEIKSFLGFSEPEEGPLSDFHTYAPDMMNLFMKGIEDNKRKLQNTVADAFDFGGLISEGSATRTVSARPALAGASGGAGFGTVALYIDKDTLVASTAEENDRALGRMTELKMRYEQA